MLNDYYNRSKFPSYSTGLEMSGSWSCLGFEANPSNVQSASRMVRSVAAPKKRVESSRSWTRRRTFFPRA